MTTLQAPSPLPVETEPMPSERRPTKRVSRRELFSPLAGLAAMWGASSALTPRQARASEVSADADPGSLLFKLVGRITFGWTEAEMALATSLGYAGYLEYHLNHTAIDDSAVNALLAPLTTLGMTPHQLYDISGGTVVTELQQALILRAVFSKRQLFERVADFWTDHFNIDINVEELQVLKTVDDRDVIRANALGNFTTLLDASMHSPAMLIYLNNNVSRVGFINENYARELMELHTMGVDGGYTQQDVIEVARCLTGWQYFRQSADPMVINEGTFRYNAGQHDNGQKIVLGNIIPAGGGINDGLMVRNILVNHPSTARYIAKKMCIRFLGESVPQAIINDVAATYTSTGGDIKSMIRTMLKPNTLYDAEPRYKRPFHQYMSALRTLPTTITSSTGIRSNLTAAGNVPYVWSSPDGYPDRNDHWMGLILPRWNFGASLMNGTTGSVSGAVVDDVAFFNGLVTADQCADKINSAMFGGTLPLADRNRIRDHMLPNNPTRTRKREAVGLAIGAPSFQWH